MRDIVESAEKHLCVFKTLASDPNKSIKVLSNILKNDTCVVLGYGKDVCDLISKLYSKNSVVAYAGWKACVFWKDNFKPITHMNQVDWVKPWLYKIVNNEDSVCVVCDEKIKLQNLCRGCARCASFVCMPCYQKILATIQNSKKFRCPNCRLFMNGVCI